MTKTTRLTEDGKWFEVVTHGDGSILITTSEKRGAWHSPPQPDLWLRGVAALFFQGYYNIMDRMLMDVGFKQE